MCQFQGESKAKSFSSKACDRSECRGEPPKGEEDGLILQLEWGRGPCGQEGWPTWPLACAEVPRRPALNLGGPSPRPPGAPRSQAAREGQPYPVTGSHGREARPRPSAAAAQTCTWRSSSSGTRQKETRARKTRAAFPRAQAPRGQRAAAQALT